jgi:hypothetical protein
VKQKKYKNVFHYLLTTIFVFLLLTNILQDNSAFAHNYQGGEEDLVTGIRYPNGRQQTFYPGEMAQIAFDVGKPTYSNVAGMKKVVYEDIVDLSSAIGPGLVWTDISQITHGCSFTVGDGSCSSAISGDKSIKVTVVIDAGQSVDKARIRIFYYGTSNKKYDHPPGTKYNVIATGVSCKLTKEDDDGNITEEQCQANTGTDHYMVACSEPPPVDLACNNITQNGIVGNMPGCLLEWDVNYSNSICLKKMTCHIRPSDGLNFIDTTGAVINDDIKFQTLNGKGSKYIYLKPTQTDGGISIGSNGADLNIGPRIYNKAKISLRCDQYNKETSKDIDISFPPRLINPWLKTQDGDVVVNDIKGSSESIDNYCLQDTKDTSTNTSRNVFIVLGNILDYSQIYHYVVPKSSDNSSDNSYFGLNNRLQSNNCLLGIITGGFALNNANNYQNVVFGNLLRELNLLSLLDSANLDLNNIIKTNPILTRDYSQLSNTTNNVKSFQVQQHRTPTVDMGNNIMLHQGDLDLSEFTYRSGITTIMVNGNVKINGNITYNGSAQNIDNLAGVAIIASGDIKLSNNVTRLDAAIMSSKNIDLCYQYQRRYQDGQICSNNLVINGPVVAANLLFNRTKILVSDKPLVPRSLTAAATISGSWKNYFTPPPGVDDRYSQRASQLEVDKRV